MKTRTLVGCLLSAACVLLTTPANAQRVLPGNTYDCPDTPTDLSFFFTTPTKIYRLPRVEASEVVATGTPGEVAMVLCVVNGWARLDLLRDGPAKGWMFGEGVPVENLVDDAWLDVRLRQVQMKDKAWPTALKWDIARKKVRVGFTVEQVTLALGKPLRKESEETASGTFDVWTYRLQTIRLTNGAVASIRTVTP